MTHRASAKMHLAFEILRSVPVKVTVTNGNGSERNELRKMLESGRLYVLDCGYAEYQLFQEIIDGESSFVGRIRNDSIQEHLESFGLTRRTRRDIRVFLRSARVIAIDDSNRERFLDGDINTALFPRDEFAWRHEH